MRVAGPSPTPSPPLLGPPSGQRDLVPGQVLHALVVGSPTANTVLLRVGELELIARTELALSRGQALVLEVIRGGDTPELRLARAPSEQGLVAQALRTSLPRLQPVGETIERLAAAWRALQQAGALPAATAKEIDRLVQGLRGAAPDHAALRQAAADSGLFLEAQLARGQPNPADLKGLLLRLVARLPPKPVWVGREAAPQEGRPQRPLEDPLASLATLREEAEALLAGLRGRQLASLPQEGQPVTWHFELPLRGPSGRETTLWLRAEREGDGRVGESRWSVVLKLELEPLGVVHAKLSLHAGGVDASLWAERPDTAALLASRLPELEAGMRRAGLEPLRLWASAGRPAMPADRPAAAGQCLLDEQA